MRMWQAYIPIMDEKQVLGKMLVGQVDLFRKHWMYAIYTLEETVPTLLTFSSLKRIKIHFIASCAKHE